MARKEVLTQNGKREPCVNVDAAVGPVKFARVKNLQGDVMLVQAILHTLGTRVGAAYVGCRSKDDLPIPNGKYDSKTENAIVGYQKSQPTAMLLTDGIIDHASYRNRNVRIFTPETRLMTITQLHIELRVLFDTSDYASELTRIVPQLLPWLN